MSVNSYSSTTMEDVEQFRLHSEQIKREFNELLDKGDRDGAISLAKRLGITLVKRKNPAPRNSRQQQPKV